MPAERMAVRARDLRAALDVVRRMNEADDETFLPTMLGAVGAAVACDSVSYNELDPGTGT
jgi:hypothetical protein